MRRAHITTAGVMTNVTQADSVTVLATAVTFSPEQQAMAQEICVNAFLDDLKTHCQQQPLVVLFDAFEKCELEMQIWLLNHFLEPHCFNVQERPAQLVVVVAGREIPAFEEHWSPDECKSIVKSRESLGTWSAAHVEECLRVHGFSYNQRQLTLFCMMIEEGYSPSHVVGAMEMLYLKRER